MTPPPPHAAATGPWGPCRAGWSAIRAEAVGGGGEFSAMGMSAGRFRRGWECLAPGGQSDSDGRAEAIGPVQGGEALSARKICTLHATPATAAGGVTAQEMEGGGEGTAGSAEGSTWGLWKAAVACCQVRLRRWGGEEAGRNLKRGPSRNSSARPGGQGPKLGVKHSSLESGLGRVKGQRFGC
jgi:hypothetical protein